MTYQEESELLQSVVEVLCQGEVLLAGLSNEAYTQKVPMAFNASIGGHYRHCLDHFRSLLNSVDSGELNYDHRERGTPVETDRAAALIVTRELISGYENLDCSDLSQPVNVTCKTSYSSGGSQSSPSIVRREIMYTVAHAVHHYALIGVMGQVARLDLPEGFGVAPSTLKHQLQVVAAF